MIVFNKIRVCFMIVRNEKVWVVTQVDIYRYRHHKLSVWTVYQCLNFYTFSLYKISHLLEIISKGITIKRWEI